MNKALFLMLVGVSLTCHAEDALQTCQQALIAGDYARAIRAGSQTEGSAGALCTGRAQLEKGDYAGATASFAEAERAATEVYDKMLATTYLARASHRTGNDDEALYHYARSLELAKKIDHQQAQMVSLNESGQILQGKGNYRVALERFRNAYTLAANDNERSVCNQLIAAAYSKLGELDKAIEYQLKSVIQEERSGSVEDYLLARLEMSSIYAVAKDFQHAEKELEFVMGKVKEAGNAYWEARTLQYMGRLERARSNPEKSRTLLTQAMRIAGDIGATELTAQIGTELKQP